MGIFNMLARILMIICLCIPVGGQVVSAIRRKRTIELNTTWTAAEGSIFVTTSNELLGAGFASVVCPRRSNSRCLVFMIAFFAKDGGITPESIIWTANADAPVAPNSRLELTADGNLVLTDSADGRVVWSTNTSHKGVSRLKLKQSGNLVLLSSNDTEIWRSFGYPTDTLLPGHLRNNMKLQSATSSFDFSRGPYSLVVEDRGVSLYVYNKDTLSSSRYGIWSIKKNETNITHMALRGNGELRLLSGNRILSRIPSHKRSDQEFQFMRIHRNGSLRLFFKDMEASVDVLKPTSKFKLASISGSCNVPLRCERYAICSSDLTCTCPSSKYFTGCKPVQPLQCNSSGQQLLELSNVDYFATYFEPGVVVSSIEDCKRMCLGNCSCEAAVFKNLNGVNICYSFRGILSLMNVTGTNTTVVTLLKVLERPRSHSRRLHLAVWVAVSLSVVTVFLLPVAVLSVKRLQKMKHESHELLELMPGVPRRFTYQELRTATKNFSNELGRGGFGTVHHGVLEDGTKVAVKRLGSTKGGDDQFRAEVISIGSLHHSNLVKLIGFCCDNRKHTLLVYEYMPNGSLDKWIFGGNEFLNWKTRSRIVLDIAKGLAYLHEGCERSVLHLDIKPQNILVDTRFKAKISDFGLAMFATKNSKHSVNGSSQSGSVNESQQTGIDYHMIRGTPGYMAPEWLHCRVSAKVDVYSFGIVLLETISGKHAGELLETLYTSVGDKLEREHLVQILDGRLQDTKCAIVEAERFVLVGLCCIQEDPSVRPSMGNVVKMLEGNMPVPDVLLNLKYQTTNLPRGIASFLASFLAANV